MRGRRIIAAPLAVALIGCPSAAASVQLGSTEPPVSGSVAAGCAGNVLRLLGCGVGRTTHRFSANIAKGARLATSPRAGTYSGRKKVNLVVSAGRRPRRHHRR